MDDGAFDEVFETVEEPLRRALVAWYGLDVGRDAAAHALGWAWEHRDRIGSIDNLGGYLFRVGQSAAKKALRSRAPVAFERVDNDVEVGFEPGLRPALESLSSQQRAAVLMVHGYGYSYREASDHLGVSLATLRTHLDRAMNRLRRDLEVRDDHAAR